MPNAPLIDCQMKIFGPAITAGGRGDLDPLGELVAVVEAVRGGFWG
jgi:hypothetical protein